MQVRTKYLAATAAAVALVAAAGAANAATYSFSLTQAPSGVQTGGFSHTVTGVAGGSTTFSDQAQFTVFSPGGNLDAQISTILLGGVANVNFTSVFLDVMDAAHMFTIKVNGDGTDQAVLASPLPVIAGAHTIFINGTLAGEIGSYAGTVNVAPAGVPEPATWAMMILGMGMVGVGLRMRRKVGVLAA